MPIYKNAINELLSEEEIKLTFQAAKNSREQLLISILTITGARPSEVLELTPDRIKISEDSVSFRLPTKKTHPDGQTFTLTDRLLEVERPHGMDLNVYVETIVEFVRSHPPGTRLLDYSLRWAELVVNRLTLQAIGRACTPYHFRHSAITREAAAHRSIDQLMHFKGAKSLDSVRPYLHATPYKISFKKD